MNIEVKYPSHLILKHCIEYFIFFSCRKNESVSYTSFPNTNLCLSVYLNNYISHTVSKNQNDCFIELSQNYFSSRVFAFHKMQFKVRIYSDIKQFCIVFRPGGIRYFSDVPYAELVNSDECFQMVFKESPAQLESMFYEISTEHKVKILEKYLLGKINPAKGVNMGNNILASIRQSDSIFDVNSLSIKLGVHPSTLYKQFLSCIGQSPIDFLNTVRFRRSISNFKTRSNIKLSDIAYDAGFFDQSHYINSY